MSMSQRRIIVVCGAQRAAGKVVAAVDLATELATTGGREVILADLDVATGWLGTVLGVATCRHVGGPVDLHAGCVDAITGHLVRVRPGLRLLAGRSCLGRAEARSPNHVAPLLHRLLEGADVLVVDAAGGNDGVTLAALALADVAVVVAESDRPTLERAHRWIDYVSAQCPTAVFKVLVTHVPAARSRQPAASRSDIRRIARFVTGAPRGWLEPRRWSLSFPRLELPGHPSRTIRRTGVAIALTIAAASVLWSLATSPSLLRAAVAEGGTRLSLDARATSTSTPMGPSEVAAPSPSVVLAAAAQATPSPSPLPSATPGSVPTATASAVPTSASPAPSATASVPPTATLTASPTTQAPLVVEERFANNERGWPDNAEGTARFADGGYRLNVRTPGRFVAITSASIPPARDVVVGAVFRKVGGQSGGGFGLILRDQSSSRLDGVQQGGRYLVFEVGDRGEIGVWRREDNRWVDIVPWTRAAAVRPGAESNEIQVRASGARIVMAVNGVDVARVEDTGPAPGRVGVFLGGDGNDVLLERFTVERVSAR